MTEFLRAEDVAAALGLKRSRVYQLVQAGELPHVKVGDKRTGVRIPRAAFDAWLARKSAEATEAVRR